MPPRPIHLLSLAYPPWRRTGFRGALANALARAGGEVSALCLARPQTHLRRSLEDPDLEAQAGEIRPLRCRMPRLGPLRGLLAATGISAGDWPLWPRAAGRTLQKRLRNRPGAVLALLPAVENAFAALSACRRTGCGCCLYLVDNLRATRRAKRRLGTLAGALPAGSLTLAAASEPLAEEMAALLGGTLPVRQVPPGWWGAAAPVALPDADGPLEAVFLRADAAGAAPERAAEALLALRETRPDLAGRLSLTIYGRATRALTKRLRPFLRDGYLEFGGELPAGAEETVLRRADLALLTLDPLHPSRGVPEALLLARKTCTPILLSGPAEAGHLHGLLAPHLPAAPAEPLALAGRLATLLSPPRQQLAESTAELLAGRPRHHIDGCAAALLDILEDLGPAHADAARVSAQG